MKVCVLMGSPRKNGNTAAILAPFCEELRKAGAEVETVWLYDREIRPCVACRNCQKDWTVFGCVQDDDGQELFEMIDACDLLVLDDLGMEFDTPFSRACLYNVLNARLLEGRPTVVSTNLSFSALQERYGDQIASRISGGFVPLLCVGKDIRQIIRRQSMG